MYIVSSGQTTGDSDAQHAETLSSLVSAHLDSIVPKWFGVLKDYAVLSLPVDFASQLPEAGVHYRLNNADEVRPYYERSWAPILLAVCTWLSNNQFQLTEATPCLAGSVARAQQDWFHVLMGISLCALCCSSRTMDNVTVCSCLSGLRTLTSNDWVQRQLLSSEPTVATELLNVLYRLILSNEEVRVHALALDIVCQLVDACIPMTNKDQPSRYACQDGGLDGVLDKSRCLAYAALEVLLCLLVRQAPHVNPTMAKSRPLLAQRKSLATASRESLQMVANAVGCLCKLPSLCTDAGKITVLPIIMYLVNNTLREASKIGNGRLESLTAVRSSSHSLLNVVSAACLQSLRQLVRCPVCREDGITPNANWIRIVQCALWSFLQLEQEVPDFSRIVLLLGVAVFILNAPDAVLLHAAILDRCSQLFRDCLFDDDVAVRLHCLRTLASVFGRKDATVVGARWVQQLTPLIVDQIKGYTDSLTSPSSLDTGDRMQLLMESVKVLESLVHSAKQDQRLSLMALVVDLLLAGKMSANGSAVGRRLLDFALDRINVLGAAYPADLKRLLSAMPSVRSQLEMSLRRSAVQSQQVVTDRSSSGSVAVAADSSITLTLDFSNYVTDTG